MKSFISDAVSFQSELEQVLHQPPPTVLRMTALIAAGFLASVVLAAGLTKTDIVVIGQGSLQADTPPVVMQPMERAIIRDVRVRPGDHVSKGELLATLDPTFTQADLNILNQQAADSQAKLMRLQAELSSKPPASLPAYGPASAEQGELYAKRRIEYNTHLASFDEKRRRAENELSAARARITKLEHQLDIANEVASMRAQLMKDAVGSRLQYLAAENARVEADKELSQLRDHIDELRKGLEEIATDRKAYITQWQREVMDDFIATRAEAARLAENRAKAARLHELIWLRAPADGIVLDVAERSAGSVLHEAEPLLTILPDHSTMIADVTVGSRDIGNLAEGNKVQVKVDAFPYQLHGMLHGFVRSIGEESFTDKSRESGAVHKVRIALTNLNLQDLPKGAALIPGMTVNAEVTVGARNVLAYFLYPVTRGLHESLREP